MTAAIKTMRLEVYDKNSTIRMWIKQYDGGIRLLHVVLTSNGIPIRAQTTDSVTLTVTRPDGDTQSFSSCTVSDDGSILAIIPEWAAQLPGVANVCITVADSAGNQLSTPGFTIEVEPFDYSNTGVSPEPGSGTSVTYLVENEVLYILYNADQTDISVDNGDLLIGG